MSGRKKVDNDYLNLWANWDSFNALPAHKQAPAARSFISHWSNSPSANLLSFDAVYWGSHHFRFPSRHCALIEINYPQPLNWVWYINVRSYYVSHRERGCSLSTIVDKARAFMLFITWKPRKIKIVWREGLLDLWQVLILEMGLLTKILLSLKVFSMGTAYCIKFTAFSRNTIFNQITFFNSGSCSLNGNFNVVNVDTLKGHNRDILE